MIWTTILKNMVLEIGKVKNLEETLHYNKNDEIYHRWKMLLQKS